MYNINGLAYAIFLRSQKQEACQMFLYYWLVASAFSNVTAKARPWSFLLTEVIAKDVWCLVCTIFGLALAIFATIDTSENALDIWNIPRCIVFGYGIRFPELFFQETLSILCNLIVKMKLTWRY